MSMKATKYTVRIVIEVLSMDCVPSMLRNLAETIEGDPNRANASHGHIVEDDGDRLTFRVAKKQVEF